MRFVAQPVIKDLAPVEAVTASIQGWLIAITAWFCDVVDALPRVAWRCPLVRAAYATGKRRIAANLRRTVGHLRQIIFMRALAAFRVRAGRGRLHRFARGVRPGVRANTRSGRQIWRIATAGVMAGMHEGSLRDRVARLRKILANPAAIVARVLKKLAAIWRAPHAAKLVLVASRENCVSLASLAPRCADTS
ncbi:MAG: hypothetical protein DCF16_16600 [Alphaproteobacteria bacterium]|nr:MAG: hypothetical protein DCF16_16600 [Alphaproteobacteria bacterium]